MLSPRGDDDNGNVDDDEDSIDGQVEEEKEHDETDSQSNI